MLLIGAVIARANFDEFNIRSVRLLLRGRVEGKERACNYLREWGVSPSPLRSGKLRGSYSEMQCVSRYGITHVHLWFTWY